MQTPGKSQTIQAGTRLVLVGMMLFAWLPAENAWAQAMPKQSAKRSVPKAGDHPADYSSAHFLIHTDLPKKDAQELLKRLETMLGLISAYWERPLAGTIECYVVKDLAKWPPGTISEAGRKKIEEGAGITLAESLTFGKAKVVTKAVVNATADRGTPQHEAVHAYCLQTFGTAGPLWYSEGMAEMGHYWRPNDTSVQIDPIVLAYFKKTEPQSLNKIVNTKSITGDSWQNYAWRWALCHLLANNTNYRDRFRPLGLGFLTEQNVSFEQIYGAMEKEISFEYLFFMEHIDQGFRCDLCSWDWKKKFKPLTPTAINVKINAAHGWQPSGVTCEADRKYDYSVSGSWQTSKAVGAQSADGDSEGRGKLVGVLMDNFKLGKPFELGTYGTFTAPGSGKLYLRCQDKWGELADNKGLVNVKLRLGGQGLPLARPVEKPALHGSPTQSTAKKPAKAGD